MNRKTFAGIRDHKRAVNLSRITCLASLRSKKRHVSFAAGSLRPSAVIPTSHMFYCSPLVSIFCLLPPICLLICASDLSAWNRFSRNTHPPTTTPFPSAPGNLEWVSNNLGRTKQSDIEVNLGCFDAAPLFEMRNQHTFPVPHTVNTTLKWSWSDVFNFRFPLFWVPLIGPFQACEIAPRSGSSVEDSDVLRRQQFFLCLLG